MIHDKNQGWVSKAVLFIVSAFLVTTLPGQVMNNMDTSGKEIIFASDTQAPMWVETLLLKRNNNRLATKDIFDNILTRHPVALYLLGDVVSMGSSNRQWKPMDAYLQRLRS